MTVVYGPGHVRTVLGLCKVIESVCLFVGIILVASKGWTNDLLDAYYAGTIIGLILSVLILVASMTEIGHSLNKALALQYIVHCVLFIYLIIVSAILVARRYHNVHTAAGAFGLIGGFVYLIDTFVSYKSYGNRLICM
ncbi:uncharacterized protein LOC132696510 isoform X2 [Cylas formicarius]|uniref:uncharacterized protein LOC132696510 isoform X2 n=1 Tax=Cylas formicarius TaxID=197179 RepID=UPI0029587ECE|nr:uncharacterized protein LOC132696510 isoform X2 [Cylas formicarius]XP_060517355.1 uncharacterized protein LOC132696510 isoform X2 [Cylas formicarius]